MADATKKYVTKSELKSMTEITYANLKSLRNSSGLTPGMWYRITDYNTTTTQEDTNAAGHQFDVIVLATNTSKLSEEAKAIKHAGDTYFTNAGANLDGWKIWYCLDNDITRFAWANSGSTGRGVIYRMIDEFNNDVPYDFKNIQFKRYKITACQGVPGLVGRYGINNSFYAANYTVDSQNPYWVYTFSMINLFENVIDDVSVYQNKYPSDEGFAYKQRDNIVKYLLRSYYDEILEETFYRYSLPDNVFVTDTDASFIEEDYSYGEFYGFSSNVFGTDCNNNTFGNGGWLNNFGNNCGYNTFGSDFCNNNLGDNFDTNIFGNSCGYNIFWNGCGRNIFGDGCSSNNFGNGCSSNNFGDGCGSNIFGNNFNTNTVGNGCAYNTFGNSCGSNIFGNYCNYNAFGNACGGNTFGKQCCHNTFGNGCKFIKFGTSSSVKDYCMYIIVEDGNERIYLSPTATTSINAYFQNVKIAQGVNNTNSYITITDGNVGQTYQTVYQSSHSQVINV